MRESGGGGCQGGTVKSNSSVIFRLRHGGSRTIVTTARAALSVLSAHHQGQAAPAACVHKRVFVVPFTFLLVRGKGVLGDRVCWNASLIVSASGEGRGGGVVHYSLRPVEHEHGRD